MKTPFHLALPCEDIGKTEDFYLRILNSKSGRRAENWIDIDLFGNQITFTKVGNFNFDFKNYRFGDQILPSFHFGVIVDEGTWKKTYALLNEKNIEITTEATFLKDKTGEHFSFFVNDPNGYQIEFKCFKDDRHIFET